MRARLQQLWIVARSSYWFIPTLMCLGVTLLAALLTRLDLTLGADWVESAPALLSVRPSGARAVLSTVAGSVIGVAGVTFSVTIAAVAYASGQYGPRLLGNFMRDRGNQVTLGTFLATFLYSLLILHTIRDPSESSTTAGDAFGFVPLASLGVSLLMALGSIAVLIYFIHHVPESIHISNVVAKIGRELRAEIQTLFPQHIGEADAADAEAPASDGRMPKALAATAASIEAHGTGYVQNLDAMGLLEVAADANLTVQLLIGPGDFVSPGTALAHAWPPERVTDDAAAAIRHAFAWGQQRSPHQNPSFLVDELVEIAARALSPGVNDPFTATNCLDWIGDALVACAGRDAPIALRRDDTGTIRLIARPVSFSTLADRAFGQLRPYVRSDRNAVLHAFAVLMRVGRQTDEGSDQRFVLARHADALWEGCQTALGQPVDVREAEEAYRSTVRLLHGRALLTPTDPSRAAG